MNELQNNELIELEEQGEFKPTFVITDLGGLNWAFRKMNALQAKINEVKSLADAERYRIDKYEKSETERYQSDFDFLSHKVTAYHEYQLSIDPKMKSIKTPYGVAKSIRSKATPDKTNEAALIEYVKSADLGFVDVEFKEKLLWSELKKTLHIIEHDGQQVVIDSNGELVPGVAVKPETVTFKIEVND